MALLLPDPHDEDAGEFWQGCARGELLVQRCESCGRRRMPPRPMCPDCRSMEAGWEPLSGRGTIWSFVVAHPPLLPAYAEFAPFPVVTVESAEEPTIRFVGNLVAEPDAPINSVDPALIRIGDPVRVTFAAVDDVTFPRWMLER